MCYPGSNNADGNSGTRTPCLVSIAGVWRVCSANRASVDSDSDWMRRGRSRDSRSTHTARSRPTRGLLRLVKGLPCLILRCKSNRCYGTSCCKP
eukprot:647121-Rhodomonas_salina.2